MRPTARASPQIALGYWSTAKVRPEGNGSGRGGLCLDKIFAAAPGRDDDCIDKESMPAGTTGDRLENL